MMFRVAPLFPGWRRFVYLVLSGAGRRAELMYATTGIKPAWSEAEGPLERAMSVELKSCKLLHRCCMQA